jgi:hypothetical protein
VRRADGEESGSRSEVRLQWLVHFAKRRQQDGVSLQENKGEATRLHDRGVSGWVGGWRGTARRRRWGN